MLDPWLVAAGDVCWRDFCLDVGVVDPVAQMICWQGALALTALLVIEQNTNANLQKNKVLFLAEVRRCAR